MSDSTKPLAVFEKDGKKREAYTPADVVKYRFDGWREKDAPANKATAKKAPAKKAPAKKLGTKKATAPKAATQPPGDTTRNTD